jgi:hypothetical protein
LRWYTSRNGAAMPPVVAPDEVDDDEDDEPELDV